MNGFRIELGEIEQVALDCSDNVGEACSVVSRQGTDSAQQLVLYIVPRLGSAENADADADTKDESVGAWQEVYDAIYDDEDEGMYAGWTDSFTGQKLAHMDEWLENTLSSIFFVLEALGRSARLLNVFEVSGC